MKRSFIYRSARIYAFLMRTLYKENYEARFRAIGEEIPVGVEVLDVCCGDCALYTLTLKEKVSYTGIDINPSFIKNARKQSIKVLPLDVRIDNIPCSDYVVMQASLYQFIPIHKQIVDKLLDSASDKVIISEPVRNLSDSSNPVVSFVARYSANPGTGHKIDRFTEETFRAFFRNNYDKLIEKFKFTPDRKELIVILNVERRMIR
jgi:hypothetical protein